MYPTDYIDRSQKNIGLLNIINQFEKDGNTLIIDAGDTIQGSPFTNYLSTTEFDVHPIAKIFNIAFPILSKNIWYSLEIICISSSSGYFKYQFESTNIESKFLIQYEDTYPDSRLYFDVTKKLPPFTISIETY